MDVGVNHQALSLETAKPLIDGKKAKEEEN